MTRYLLKSMNRWIRMVLILMLFLYSAGGPIFNAHASITDMDLDLELPEPTGTYGIGTTLLHLEDTSRFEEMTPDPDDYREIMVQVWYPAEKDDLKPANPYMDPQTTAYFMEDVPDDLKDVISGGISTHAVASSPPVVEPNPFPLLIFSPGLGTVYSQYQALIEDVVSHGYVVAAINHPYISEITVFPDGRAIMAHDGKNDPSERHHVVVEDIKFLTGQLESIEIGNKILIPDVENIGFFGHSFGGSGSVEAGLQLPQGKCAINIDGSLWGSSHLQSIDKPLLFMMNENHSVFMYPQLATAWKNISQDGYFMNLDGAEHFTFADSGILFYQLFGSDFYKRAKDYEIGVGSINPQKAIRISKEYIVAFFNRYLKNMSQDAITTLSYPEVSLQQTGPADGYDGIWHSIGYGYYLEIKDSEITRYETTDEGGLPLLQGKIHNNLVYLEDHAITRLVLSEDSLVVTGNGYPTITFEPAEDASLPRILDNSDDPVLNFNVFWQTFEEHFALFDLVDVDWKMLYDKYRPSINNTTTNEELFTIFSSMIAPLNDGHTSITDEDSNRTASSGPALDRCTQKKLTHAFGNIPKYMDNGELKSEAGGLIQYGTINGSIGYLNLRAFGGYESAESPEAQKIAFDQDMDTIFKKFETLDALIIDLRFNGGGHDLLALALAGRFTEQSTLAHSKRFRIGDYDEFSAPIERYIKPSHGYTFINKPVILLTSNITASAAEVFVMTIEQLENVTLIGEKTYGAFSDSLGRTLPNGWTFSLSNERYTSWDGVDYEQQGISPDIEITYDASMLKQGKDNVLNKSISYLNSDDETIDAEDEKKPGGE